jgi:hypothetical protein
MRIGGALLRESHPAQYQSPHALHSSSRYTPTHKWAGSRTRENSLPWVSRMPETEKGRSGNQEISGLAKSSRSCAGRRWALPPCVRLDVGVGAESCVATTAALARPHREDEAARAHWHLLRKARRLCCSTAGGVRNSPLRRRIRSLTRAHPTNFGSWNPYGSCHSARPEDPTLRRLYDGDAGKPCAPHSRRRADCLSRLNHASFLLGSRLARKREGRPSSRKGYTHLDRGIAWRRGPLSALQ